jgi:hypothetical protein
MQQMIRTSHFSRATLYALMANCLQFEKEGQNNPNNTGTSSTRAKVCELIAIKLLKEYSTRELIDALSYDFFPLQGLVPAESPVAPGPAWEQKVRARPAASRTSTLEVAIRAQAKKFLAHPVVVQQLEAIWAGTIVFHSAADNLHRPQPKPISNHIRGYGSTDQTPRLQASPDKTRPGKPGQVPAPINLRRTVTLYDPRDASLFKLSRLRVPRYRQFLSTCSLAVLLGLFLAVLIERSLDITTLEVIFWFWSAGFMLDELVGFNEQGFSLYIMSFWNTFDLGILMLLIIYYGMRLYGIFLADVGKHEWNGMAYDVLAANAVLLFPRLFSVLDHYRYFSQLLIAFRLMTVDLIAVFILIIIACSGFFVAFTLSFGKDEYDGGKIMFKMFQQIMGFTPAAWEVWPTYNPLGKAILTLFLFICHFLIVTILITVLTNSFTKIVSNANEEHQFVFAVNTISMVKNDALFSYIAPSNILAWLLAPLRYMIPFKQFIKLNRTAIKITHFPLLFSIFAYEKLLLARTVFEPMDLVENRGRKRMISFEDPSVRTALFSPTVRLRQESVAGFQKDRALDEVFRLAPRGVGRGQKSQERQSTSSAVHNWMDHQAGMADSPAEQDRGIVDYLETRRLASKRARLIRRESSGRGISGTRSVASDPADLMSNFAHQDAQQRHSDTELRLQMGEDHGHQTDADGDDELGPNDDDETMTLDKASRRTFSVSQNSDRPDDSGYFRGVTAARGAGPPLSTSAASHTRFSANIEPPSASTVRHHTRNPSVSTILFNPQMSSSATPPRSRPITAKATPVGTGTHTPSGRRSPKRTIYSSSKPRPIMPPRSHFLTAPAREMPNSRAIRHRRSSLDMDTHSDITRDDFSTRFDMVGGVPSSFATQMAVATGMVKGQEGETERMMGRLMLARMKTLEEGFQEVVRNLEELRSSGSANSPVERGLKRRKRKERPITRAGPRGDENAYKAGPMLDEDGEPLKRGSSL